MRTWTAPATCAMIAIAMSCASACSSPPASVPKGSADTGGQTDVAAVDTGSPDVAPVGADADAGMGQDADAQAADVPPDAAPDVPPDVAADVPLSGCKDPTTDCKGAADKCKPWACEAGACVQKPVADGATCDDGSQCTSGDACKAGACAGTAKECTADKPCTIASCDTTSGQCQSTPAADGATCLGGTCTSGACVLQGSVVMVDGKFSTTSTPNVQGATYGLRDGQFGWSAPVCAASGVCLVGGFTR